VSIGSSTYDHVLDGVAMETVTISARFQVVIPKVSREKLGLSPGQKVQVLLYGDRIELIPLQPARRQRGFLKGIDTTVPREPDRG
jgi:AbrB family looped-hinge helix DNA binding protein